MLLFNFNIKEVQEVIQNITSIVVPKNYFTNGLILNCIALVALGIYYSNKLVEFKNRWMLETFYLLVFTVIFRVSSLIWGFAIYFIIWHSIPSIINQINYLNGEVSWNNFRKYIRSAFLYWVISLIGIATLYLLFKDIEIFNALFFSFLAAITFPHVLVIFILFKKK
jgi:Brp/Blh family beta-carotene 15,15'-monooxygenase